VSGTCIENVVIDEEKERITVDGQGSATVNGPDPTFATVSVRGRAITIKGFTITGGENGVNIMRGGTAIIDGNTIQSTGRVGINVFSHSFARIVGNTIQNNPAGGIIISENSFARIGFLQGDDTLAVLNTIQTNGGVGIGVFRSSGATIVEYTISNNSSDGVIVTGVSHADISKNTIDSNGRHGINVGENSGVNLGQDSGTGIFEAPNDTTVGSGNGTAGGGLDFGINCFINSYANGRLGTLNGIDGAKGGFGGSCIDSLIP